jgi:hypothetical protein
VIIRGNVIQDSWRAGLFIAPVLERVTVEKNRIIHPVAAGVLIAPGVTGAGTFAGNTITELNAGQPEFKNESEKTFEVTLKANPPEKQGASK